MASDDWQPIDAAPKKGQWVLLYAPDRGVHAAQWIEYCGLWQAHDGEYQREPPTHWMPFPAPPLRQSVSPVARVQGTVSEFIEINGHSDIVPSCTHCGADLPRVHNVSGGSMRLYALCSCPGARGGGS